MDSDMNIEYKIFIQPRRNLKQFSQWALMNGKAEGVASAHNPRIFGNELKIFIGLVYNRKLCAVMLSDTISGFVLAATEAADARTFSVAHTRTRPDACPTPAYCMKQGTQSPSATGALTDIRRVGLFVLSDQPGYECNLVLHWMVRLLVLCFKAIIN
jgi:hypothetical protein